VSTLLLHLHLRFEYFDAVKRGEKTEEFRACTPFNTALLAKAPFAGIKLYRGYPKDSDHASILNLSWRGYEERIITHPHFANKPTRVFAIKLR